MKNLLYILLFTPVALYGQSTAYIEQDVPLELFEGWNMFGYSCYEPIDVALSFTSIEDKIVIVKDNSGNVYMPEFGFNGIGSLERNRGYQIKLTEAISDFQFCPFLVPLVEGCMDETAFNYNPSAHIDDGSCGYFGCIDVEACNYDSDTNTDDGSCEYPNPGYDCFGDDLENCIYPDSLTLSMFNDYYPTLINGPCVLINDVDTITSINIDYQTENLDWLQHFTNLSSLNIQFNDSLNSLPDLSNLTNLSVLNILANNSLTSLPDLSNLTNLSRLDISENDNLTSLPELSGLHNLDTLIIYGNDNLISIPNMSGPYNLNFLSISGNDNLTSLPELSDSSFVNDFYIFSNDALTSLPDLSGLTNLNYLVISDNESLTNLSGISGLTNLDTLIIFFNDALTSLSGISGLTNLSRLDIYQNNALHSISELSGLTNLNSLSISFNNALTSLPDLSDLTNLNSLQIYDNDALTNLPDLSGLTNLNLLEIYQNDALTNLPDLSGLSNLNNLYLANIECVEGYPEHLTIQVSWPPVCEEEVTYQVGDLAEGGIVFYVDETGEHGLVAAIEDLPGTYEWGCFTGLLGADGIAIGAGLQNTLEIVAGCSETPIAASEALAYESEGYSDWYLPSKEELYEMYNTIGWGGSVNIGGFYNNWYWSSSERDNYDAWSVNFSNSSTDYSGKHVNHWVRVIRSF